MQSTLGHYVDNGIYIAVCKTSHTTFAEKEKNEKNQHWDHANAFEASSLMFVTKQTNVQTDKTKQKTKQTKNNQNKTQFNL